MQDEMQFMASLGDIQGGLHCAMPQQAEFLQKYNQVTNILEVSAACMCAGYHPACASKPSLSQRPHG